MYSYENRLFHCYKVGVMMEEKAKELNWDEQKIKEMFFLGLFHDVGYKFGEYKDHHKNGGDFLKSQNYPYYKEVYYHGMPTKEYSSLELDLLNWADMHINRYAKYVEYEERLDGIKERYGEDSKTYTNAVKICKDLNKKGYN